MEHAPVRKHEDPYLDAITAYTRVEKLALRQLAAYLEHGPLATRRRAFEELRRLASDEPRWSGLRAIADEAALVERDRSLKHELERLRKELGASSRFRSDAG